MSSDDELKQYYKEQMESWMAKQVGHTCYKSLLDALLESGYMVDSALVAVSGHQPDGTCLIIQGKCFNEDNITLGFRAVYITNPNWQNPTEHPYMLDSIEVDEP